MPITAKCVKLCCLLSLTSIFLEQEGKVDDAPPEFTVIHLH